MTNDAIVILNGARTPMGGFQGALKNLSATDLGATAIKAAVARSGVSVDDIDEVIMGCILSAGLGQGMHGKRCARLVCLTPPVL